jgi:hypothetical protein
MTGAGVGHPEKLPASPDDIVPTLLYSAGLPVDDDMDGRVLTDAFSDEAAAPESAFARADVRSETAHACGGA